jgi:sulfate transport system ATP-binding protein
MSIKITGVGKRFGDFVALADIDLDIATGELTALLGPSGGGKSTLLRIIAGLEVTDRGSVEIEGVDATGLPAQKRNVGFVFQHYAAFRHLTVAGNVGFGLKIRKRPRKEIAARVDELLDLVHLSQFADRLPAQLSGGQRQRMALARALAIEPTVLLLDEPFGALDANVRKELRAWLRRLHDEVHVTTVFVTHDREEALDVADRIVVINQGRIAQVGPPDELYDHPTSEFVMSFLGPVTTLDGHLVRPHDLEIETHPFDNALPGRIERFNRVGFEVRLDVRLIQDDAAPPVLVTLTRAEATAKSLEIGVPVWITPVKGASQVRITTPVTDSHDLAQEPPPPKPVPEPTFT